MAAKPLIWTSEGKHDVYGTHHIGDEVRRMDGQPITGEEREALKASQFIRLGDGDSSPPPEPEPIVAEPIPAEPVHMDGSQAAGEEVPVPEETPPQETDKKSKPKG